MLKIKQAIVVEGRYDKSVLSSFVDALIICTDGFRIFSDEDKITLLRKLQQQRGLIIFTDSDGAGFLIRNKLKGMLGSENITHAYIPDVFGKERRKAKPSNEGNMGVEGIDSQTLIKCLERAGAVIEGEGAKERGGITKADLFADGITGRPDSALRRAALLKLMEMPEHTGTNALLEVINALYTVQEYKKLVNRIIL